MGQPRLPRPRSEAHRPPAGGGLWNSVLTGQEGRWKPVGWQGGPDTHIEYTSSACPHDPLSHRTSLKKYKFKDRSIKKFKVAVAERETKLGAFLSGALWSWPCPLIYQSSLFSRKDPPPSLFTYIGVYLFIINMDS